MVGALRGIQLALIGFGGMGRRVGMGAAALLAAGTVAGGLIIAAGPSTPPSGGTCDRNATTATFAAQVSAATAGETVCLADGDYGAFGGTSKAITVKGNAGGGSHMTIAFGTGDSSFTLDGVTVDGTGGTYQNINGSASNITIRNSTFDTANIHVSGSTSGIVFDGNTFLNAPSSASLCCSLFLDNPATVKNNLFDGLGISNADAIQVRTAGGATIIDNEIRNLTCCTTGNHQDAIQGYSQDGGNVIRGNYIHDNNFGISFWDGANNETVTNNVLTNIVNGAAIDLWSDGYNCPSTGNCTALGGSGSVIAHNTVVGNSINVSHKSGNGTSSGTVVRDNVASSLFVGSGDVLAVNTRNLFPSGATGTNLNGTPVFTGGASPSTYAGFRLAAGSPGKLAASDGTDVGIP